MCGQDAEGGESMRLWGKKRRDYAEEKPAKMVFDKNLCENCHSELEKKDKYCRYCGTKRGKGAYRPERMEGYCVYAPPIISRFTCRACGYKWTVDQLGRDESEYCPQCGEKKLSVQYEDEE